jgi:crossover junction endodeoxyribonuclease RuvC
MTTYVVGLDLSLTGTGISTPDGVRLVESKGAKAATLADRAHRLDSLMRKILRDCSAADLVVIEQPAFSRTQGSQHDRSGLWWLVVSSLIYAGVPVAEVTPSGRAKYATGKGNAGKDAVLGEVIRRFPGYTDSNNNTADAYVLMAMGLEHVGHPLVELPKTHRDALDAVRWPEGLTK